jgi:hypothetical protein
MIVTAVLRASLPVQRWGDRCRKHLGLWRRHVHPTRKSIQVLRDRKKIKREGKYDFLCSYLDIEPAWILPTNYIHQTDSLIHNECSHVTHSYNSSLLALNLALLLT